MIEAAMLIALGFLFALLIGFMIIPAISRRADRLARKRAEAAFPVSLSEVEAERDHLRAGFAVRQQDLERQASDGFAARAAAMEEIGRRDMDITRLTSGLADRNLRIGSLEQELAQTQSELAVTRTTLAATVETLAGTRDTLSARLGDISELETGLKDVRRQLQETTTALTAREQELAERNNELQLVTAELQAREGELAMLGIEKAGLQVGLADSQTQLATLDARCGDLSGRLATASQSLIETREALKGSEQERRAALDRAGELARQARELEARLAGLEETAQRTRAELSARVDELVGARRDITAEKKMVVEVSRALKAAETRLGQLDGLSRQEAEAVAGSLRKSEARVERLKSENAALAADLAEAKADRARLKQEVVALRRDADRLDATIRAENAALRGEIAKVADQILARARAAEKRPPTPATPG